MSYDLNAAQEKGSSHYRECQPRADQLQTPIRADGGRNLVVLHRTHHKPMAKMVGETSPRTYRPQSGLSNSAPSASA